MKVYVVISVNVITNSSKNIYVGGDVKKAWECYQSEWESENEHTVPDIQVWIDGVESMEEDEDWLALI